jgi:hypothetical protein
MTIVSRLAWDRGVGMRQSSPVNQSLAAPERTAFKAQTDLLAKVELVAVRQLGRRLDPNSVNEGSVGRAVVDHATATDPPVHRGMSSADGELQDGHDPSAGSRVFGCCLHIPLGLLCGRPDAAAQEDTSATPVPDVGSHNVQLQTRVEARAADHLPRPRWEVLPIPARVTKPAATKPRRLGRLQCGGASGPGRTLQPIPGTDRRFTGLLNGQPARARDRQSPRRSVAGQLPSARPAPLSWRRP